MPDPIVSRQSLVVDLDVWRDALKNPQSLQGIREKLESALKTFAPQAPPGEAPRITLSGEVGLPRAWSFVAPSGSDFRPLDSKPDRILVISLELTIEPGPTGMDVDAERTLASDLVSLLADAKNGLGFMGIGADFPVLPGDHWSPGEGGRILFGRRAEAEKLIGVPELRDGRRLRGRNVNVVVVDQGVDSRSMPAANYGGGWSDGVATPGAGDPAGHGTMMARNILKIAPDAKIFDMPLIPKPPSGLRPSIHDVPAFLGEAIIAFNQMLADIRALQIQDPAGRWVLVNAWAIYDSRSEFPKGSYTADKNHWFNRIVGGAAANGIDVLFCAGNCGQFSPDQRCGPADRGPCRSILGAGSLDTVFTVGAVRTDATWIGYSSQGPGRIENAAKPDLCAPTQFCEDDDAFRANPGTSAATAVAAGVVAALRQKWDPATVSPAQLRDALRATARPIEGAPNDRVGHGVIDGAAAAAALDRLAAAAGAG